MAADQDVFRSASDIVTTCIQENVSERANALPKPSNLVRVANKYRQKSRPDEPKDDNAHFDVSA